MSTLTLRVPDDLDKALERQSAAQGMSKTDFVLEVLPRYLRVAEFRQLRTHLFASVHTNGIHTDEDIFAILDKKSGLSSTPR